MSLVIVSGVRIVRELLQDFFSRIHLHEVRSAGTLDEAGTIGPKDVLLVHAEGSLDVIEELLDQIEAEAQGQGEPRQLILMVPASLHAAADHRFGDRVRALLPDDTTPAALFGAACVVAEGFGVDGHAAAEHRPTGLEDTASAADHRPRRDALPLSDRLSPQESRILLGLVRGRSNKEIAIDLGIREATVKVHLRTCFEKIGARNRTQAALWASERLGGAA